MSFLSSCAVITPHPSLSSSTQPGKGNDLCFLFCDAVLSLHQNPVSQSTQSAIVITLLAGVLGPRQKRANQWPSLRWNVLPLGARRSGSPTREQWARAPIKKHEWQSAYFVVVCERVILRDCCDDRERWFTSLSLKKGSSFLILVLSFCFIFIFICSNYWPHGVWLS